MASAISKFLHLLVRFFRKRLLSSLKDLFRREPVLIYKKSWLVRVLLVSFSFLCVGTASPQGSGTTDTTDGGQATGAKFIAHRAATFSTATTWFPVLFQVAPPDRLTELTEELRQFTIRGDHQAAGRLIPSLMHEIAKGQPEAAALAWNQAGVYFAAQGDYAEAERAYLKALRIAERQKDNSHGQLLVMANLATLYLETGRPVLAEHFSRRSLVRAQEGDSPSLPESSSSYYLLGAARLQQGDTREGRKYLVQALELADRSGDPERLRGEVLMNLAALERTERNWDRARDLFLQALAITESSMGSSHPYVIRIHLNLGRIYEQLKQWEKASASLARAREITELRLGPGHLLMAEILKSTASVLRKTGHGREGRQLRRQADAIAKAQPKDSGTVSVHVSELEPRTPARR